MKDKIVGVLETYGMKPDTSHYDIAEDLLFLFSVSQQSKLLEALKGIERECDNQNPTHENIWRIANGAIKDSNCG